ncbi:MAG: DnaJ domain-containing protein [Desulfobacterales bacterium]|jgi:DnaJ-class molecular chaperone
MANNFDLPILDEDPQNILGVSQDADAGEIRAAYLNKIKEYPPERCPQEFERVRDAYEMLNDPRHRARVMLQSVKPEASLATLLDNQKQDRQFVGPDVWLAAMREK